MVWVGQLWRLGCVCVRYGDTHEGLPEELSIKGDR